MNLNHIFLFLAIVSPLLVLARAWRPSAPYHGWRLAALVVLAVTAVAWLLWPDVSGYVGGAAWFLLLFLPAIALRKITQLAAQGDYESAGRLGAALQILHPTAELREQVRLFRHLKSNAAHSRAFSSVPADHDIAPSTRRSQLRSAPAVFVLILVNVLVFLFEISAGDWNDPRVLHRIGALEPDAVVAQGEYWRLFTALFLHGGFLHLAFNLFALYVLGPPLERSIGTIRFLACYLISGLASSAGVVALNEIGLVQVGSTHRRFRLHHGRGRRVGGIFTATSSCAIRETAARKHRPDRRDPDRIRSFHAAGQHGRAHVRISRGIFSRAHSRAASCSRGR